MKTLYLLGALSLVLLNGCEDVADSVREGLPLDTRPQMRTYAADPRTTYAAALKAIAQMDYHYVQGGPAQGELKAISGVAPGDDLANSHQFTLKAQFRPTLDGKSTDVTLWMTEVIETDSTNHRGVGTETPLRDTSLPQVFFDTIQQVLAAPPKAG